MAHLVETMAYAGEVPWHGLGVSVSNDLTPNQMMEKAGLDWTVDKVDAFVRIGDKEVSTGQQALVRSSDNKILTNVGKDWNPVQNEEAFEFFSEYVLAGDMEMHTAGSLKEGKMVWALAKVKESFDILGGDQVDSYLLFSNPHEYGKSIDVRFTPIRVVCNNTLTMSLNAQANNQVKINHRTEFNADAVKETLGIAHEKFAKYKETAEFLASKRYSAEALIQYYNEIFPRSYDKNRKVEKFEDLTRTAQDAVGVLHTQPGAEFAEGSWWQALNSVTFLTDHKMGRSADSRMSSSWFGINQARKVKAINKAIEYAEAA
jgi:phage/plasmid-like protein (TIGR03299 family)